MKFGEAKVKENYGIQTEENILVHIVKSIFDSLLVVVYESAHITWNIMRNLEKNMYFFLLVYLLLGIIWFRRKLKKKTPMKLNDYLCRMILIATVWRCHRNIYWSCWHTLEFVGVLNYSGVKTRRRHQGCLYSNCDHLFFGGKCEILQWKRKSTFTPRYVHYFLH